MCQWGTDAIVTLAHPMEVSGRTEITVDACLAPLVQALNDAGVHTLGCCCGHGHAAGSILYEQNGTVHEISVSQTEQPAAPSATPPPPKGLFQQGDFTLHGGQETTWKIDCDALTDADVQTLAAMLVERLPSFGSVEGVPTGGLRLADALKASIKPWATHLIVDDVITTGGSMEAVRKGRKAIGAVLFARGPCPSWVTPLFSMSATPPPPLHDGLKQDRSSVRLEALDQAGRKCGETPTPVTFAAPPWPPEKP